MTTLVILRHTTRKKPISDHGSLITLHRCTCARVHFNPQFSRGEIALQLFGARVGMSHARSPARAGSLKTQRTPGKAEIRVKTFLYFFFLRALRLCVRLPFGALRQKPGCLSPAWVKTCSTFNVFSLGFGLLWPPVSRPRLFLDIEHGYQENYEV